ncbi:spore germination protein [Paenibacillus silviterrae]|uniref:spore germination protein n=1 Tax=Paenibacillus silviterrae TaxID=3242194 RepID=UPI002542CFFC|nr:spore germination protein [Paenibacillus chinjuensis]
MLQQISSSILNLQLWIGATLAFIVPFGLSYVCYWLTNQRKRRRKGRNKRVDGGAKGKSIIDQPVRPALEDNLLILKEVIGHSSDVRFRSLSVDEGRRNIAVVYIEGLVNHSSLQDHIIRPIMEAGKIRGARDEAEASAEQTKQYLLQHVIQAAHTNIVTNIEQCVREIVTGNTILLIDGTDRVAILSTPKEKGRSIDEPVTEAVIRGAHEGFVENLSPNIGLLRKRIKDHQLSVIPYTIGRRSLTEVSLVFMKDLCDEAILNEVKRRLDSIEIDNVLESGYIEQIMEDNYLSFFPQMQTTERPDRVVGALMEGRIAILTDGTPMALIVPVTLPTFMSAPDDYYERWLPGTFVRLLRYLAAGIALFLPSIYIAMISYNHGLIPTKLAISIASGREGVPFPSLFEALMMEITIEILREAGLRLPKPIGQAVGIVGGLVIGQAAVQAGIVSPVMVIIVALTAMSSFAIAQYEMGISIRLLRFFSMISAGIFGIYGIVLFGIFITAHLVKLKSFGVPYTLPFGPMKPVEWKDSLVRMPMPFLKIGTPFNKKKHK